MRIEAAALRIEAVTFCACECGARLKLCLAILLPLLLVACSAAIPAPATFSDKSLLGPYKLTATISPYTKFGGGPQLGSGEVNFDGARKLSGWQTYWVRRRL